MKTPELFLCGIPGVSTLYKAEVQRRQPTGPYHLSGWSAGGIIAYEVAQQLIREGEGINRVILLAILHKPNTLVVLGAARLHHHQQRLRISLAAHSAHQRLAR